MIAAGDWHADVRGGRGPGWPPHLGSRLARQRRQRLRRARCRAHEPWPHGAVAGHLGHAVLRGAGGAGRCHRRGVPLSGGGGRRAAAAVHAQLHRAARCVVFSFSAFPPLGLSLNGARSTAPCHPARASLCSCSSYSLGTTVAASGAPALVQKRGVGRSRRPGRALRPLCIEGNPRSGCAVCRRGGCGVRPDAREGGGAGGGGARRVPGRGVPALPGGGAHARLAARVRGAAGAAPRCAAPCPGLAATLITRSWRRLTYRAPRALPYRLLAPSRRRDPGRHAVAAGAHLPRGARIAPSFPQACCRGRGSSTARRMHGPTSSLSCPLPCLSPAGMLSRPGLIYRAALEGVVLSLLAGARRMQALGLPPPTELRLVGGGARSALLRRIVADAFQLPVRCVVRASAGRVWTQALQHATPPSNRKAEQRRTRQELDHAPAAVAAPPLHATWLRRRALPALLRRRRLLALSFGAAALSGLAHRLPKETEAAVAPDTSPYIAAAALACLRRLPKETEAAALGVALQAAACAQGRDVGEFVRAHAPAMLPEVRGTLSTRTSANASELLPSTASSLSTAACATLRAQGYYALGPVGSTTPRRPCSAAALAATALRGGLRVESTPALSAAALWPCAAVPPCRWCSRTRAWPARTQRRWSGTCSWARRCLARGPARPRRRDLEDDVSGERERERETLS